MLILLYSKDEISFDRFHQKQSHVYRIVQAMQVGRDEPNKMGITQPPLAEAFKKKIPETLSLIISRRVYDKK